jgi:hypothetical protein
LIGLTKLRSKETVFVLPKYDPKRAEEVLEKIDAILTWEQEATRTLDHRFTELGQHLCEVRAGQYWRLEGLNSFDEFLATRFPASRRKAYYLMSIHEQLPSRVRKHLAQIGWAKAIELVKVARADRDAFDSATWLHKANSLAKDDFRHEVEQHLTGKQSEKYEILYFKVYKSQLPVIEDALETAAMMLGSDRSRSYCLEMICADFLAGAHTHESGQRDVLIGALRRTLAMLSEVDRQKLMDDVGDKQEAA